MCFVIIITSKEIFITIVIPPTTKNSPPSEILEAPAAPTTSHRPHQPDIPRAAAHKDIERPHRRNPRLRKHIPIAKILPPNIERHCGALARAQRHLLEAAQLLGRRCGRRRRQADVELCHLGGCDGAAVEDRAGHGRDVGVEARGSAGGEGRLRHAGFVEVGGGQGGVGEGGVC